MTCALSVTLLGLGCGGHSERRIEGQTLTVACGHCVFHMPEAVGCPWAAELDGKRYLVQGSVPYNHQSHEPDGICNMPRKAVVDGVVRNGKLIVSRLELLPPEDVPTNPTYTPADIH